MSSPPILPLGVSKRAGCDIFWSLSRKRDGYATQPNPMCHRTSNLKDDHIHVLRDYSRFHMLSRNWCPGGNLAIWSDVIYDSALFSYHTCTYYHLLFLLPAVAAIDVLAGTTGNCLLHELAATICCSVMWRVHILYCCCCSACLLTVCCSCCCCWGGGVTVLYRHIVRTSR